MKLLQQSKVFSAQLLTTNSGCVLIVGLPSSCYHGLLDRAHYNYVVAQNYTHQWITLGRSLWVGGPAGPFRWRFIGYRSRTRGGLPALTRSGQRGGFDLD